MSENWPDFYTLENDLSQDGSWDFYLASLSDSQWRNILGREDDLQEDTDLSKEKTREWLVIGWWDSWFLQYIWGLGKIKLKSKGLFLKSRPIGVWEGTEIRGSFHSQFMPDGEPWKFSSSIADTKTLTLTRGSFPLWDEKVEWYMFEFSNKKTKQWIDEDRVRIGVTFAQGENYSLKAAVSHIRWEYDGKSYDQSALQLAYEKEMLGSIFRLSGYSITIADLGKLEDGSSLLIGRSWDLVHIDPESKVQADTLSGIHLSSRSILDNKKAELKFSLDLLKDFDNRFWTTYALRYSRVQQGNHQKWSIDVATNWADEHELAVIFGRYFDAFWNDRISTEFWATYNTQEWGDFTFEIRYYVNEKAWMGKDGAENFNPKYRDFSDGINTSYLAPNFARIQEK